MEDDYGNNKDKRLNKEKLCDLPDIVKNRNKP